MKDNTMTKTGVYIWINERSFSIDQIDFIFKLWFSMNVVATIVYMQLKIKRKENLL